MNHSLDYEIQHFCPQCLKFSAFEKLKNKLAIKTCLREAKRCTLCVFVLLCCKICAGSGSVQVGVLSPFQGPDGGGVQIYLGSISCTVTAGWCAGGLMVLATGSSAVNQTVCNRLHSSLQG